MNDSRSQFIEVVGEGCFQEEATQYILHLTLSVDGRRRDRTAAELSDLKEQCIRHLLECGIVAEQITDGGAGIEPGYMRRRQRTSTHRLIVKAGDQQVLQRAIAAVEPLFETTRHTLNTGMSQPVFQPDDGVVARAQKLAFASAKAKAEVLATEADVALGDVLQVQELSSAHRASGAMGDNDWLGDETRFQDIGCTLNELTSTLPNGVSPQRTLWLRYRVRFAIAPAETAGGGRRRSGGQKRQDG